MTEPLAALLGALVGSGAAAAWFAPGYLRRKARADTAAVFVTAARDLVDPLRAELRELRGEITVYKQRLGSLERQEREMFGVLASHAAWDMALVSSARSAGVTVVDPPPLFSPHRPARTRATDDGTPAG